MGSEVIDRVEDRSFPPAHDEEMAEMYRKFFGGLFPHLDTDTPLDFNRCVTYRSRIPALSGTKPLMYKNVGNSRIIATMGCFGVGVKFGPAVGQAVSMFATDQELVPGMGIFESGDPSLFEGVALKDPHDTPAI